ncbi:hypothetical protein [Streptomyces sp. NPDC058545]|uniref:hypothetical protein n=1 Tax=Streptomyces sp. NPDC058545 TaxID=3346544 RepID=UPI00365BEB7A
MSLFRSDGRPWITREQSVESTFATVRLPTKVTRGAGSRAAGPAMVFKLVESAQAHWRAVDGARLVPPVRAVAVSEHGSWSNAPEDSQRGGPVDLRLPVGRVFN